MFVAVGVLGYLVLQLNQLGKQTATAPPAVAGPTQPPPPNNQPPAAPAARVGQGALKATSRVIEPGYTVGPGDTLGSIAAKFGTSVEALQSINNLADRNVLSVGQKLVIPNQE